VGRSGAEIDDDSLVHRDSARSGADTYFLLQRRQLVVDLARARRLAGGATLALERAELRLDLVARQAAGATPAAERLVELLLSLHGGLDALDLVLHALELGEGTAAHALGAQPLDATARLGLLHLRDQRALPGLQLESGTALL